MYSIIKSKVNCDDSTSTYTRGKIKHLSILLYYFETHLATLKASQCSKVVLTFVNFVCSSVVLSTVSVKVCMFCREHY